MAAKAMGHAQLRSNYLMSRPANLKRSDPVQTFDPSCFGRRFLRLAFTTLLFVGVWGLPFGRSAFAQRGDSFEGAVWRFSMTPKVRRKEPMRGVFRVNNYEVFQKEKPDDEAFSKQVGKVEPNGDKTRIVFHDATAFERSRSSGPGAKPGSGDGKLGSGQGRRTELKGTAALKMEKFGEWSGILIDSEGNHWDFKCSRIQE